MLNNLKNKKIYGNLKKKAKDRKLWKKCIKDLSQKNIFYGVS